MSRFAICPDCACGKKFINEDSLKRHIEEAHPKHADEPRQKGWKTPYGFIDFDRPATYAEACKAMREATAKFWPVKGEE